MLNLLEWIAEKVLLLCRFYDYKDKTLKDLMYVSFYNVTLCFKKCVQEVESCVFS